MTERKKRMKIFISQPMRNRSDQEIKAERDKIMALMNDKFSDAVEEVPSYLPEMYQQHLHEPLYMLGFSLQMMADADVAVFAPNWWDARGCKIEHDAATNYGVPYVDISEEDL